MPNIGIIQHNIPAMNAYRNYKNNSTALSKSLEKLTSAYRINRAGDDAAGLAISEKMRAQITGLEVAQKNAKDGISMVQTAEGALTEVHDMLNRMYSLAEQSANGTYADDVDREQLQKEVEQLRTEINRISKSTNFNGIKLLDGSLDADHVVTAAVAGGTTVSTVSGDITIAATAASPVLGADTILHGSGAAAATGQFALDLNNYTLSGSVGDEFVVKVRVGGSTASTGFDLSATVKITTGTSVGATAIAAALKTAATAAYAADSTAFQLDDISFNATSAAGARVLFKADAAGDVDVRRNVSISAQKVSATTTAAGTNESKATYGSFAWDAGVTLDDKLAAASDAKLSAGVSFTFTVGKNYTLDVATNSSATGATYAASVGTDFASGDKISWGAFDVGTYVMKLEKATAGHTALATLTGAAGSFTVTAAAAGSAYNFGLYTSSGTRLGGFKVDGSDYAAVSAADTVAYTAGGTATAVASALASAQAAVAAELGGVATDYGTTAGTLVSFADTVTLKLGAADVTPTLDDHNVSTEDLTPGDAGSNARIASTVATEGAFAGKIYDGAILKLGHDYYQFAIGSDSAYATATGATWGVGTAAATVTGARFHVINMTDVANDTAGLSGSDLETALRKVTDVASANEMWGVGYQDGKMTLTENATYYNAGIASKVLLNTVDKIKANFTFNDVEKTDTVAPAAAVMGKALTLQIGDTAEDFNQMSLNIKSMNTNDMVTYARDSDGNIIKDANGNYTYATGSVNTSIGNIDISTQEGAAKAMQVIKDAINYVSDVRGTLGATQNRLDHTINNLGVMQENIQDAESSIRDTDVAEEIMNFTRNSIKVQAAQAMLAQANQLPQGVLQLIG